MLVLVVAYIAEVVSVHGYVGSIAWGSMLKGANQLVTYDSGTFTEYTVHFKIDPETVLTMQYVTTAINQSQQLAR